MTVEDWTLLAVVVQWMATVAYAAHLRGRRRRALLSSAVAADEAAIWREEAERLGRLVKELRGAGRVTW